ncbi:FtsX-like permease family protein [Actinoplanes rectilineatus]|uniref:FtsX-like permease family protein n=1 Tax=Actinoplanes rectilineatus TaxID=113571 RepID=UPI0005F2E48E|nr:FtsX-like permease family protein [Actinoplanes rectilineatus]
MFALVAGAVRTRTAQVATILVLAAVATAVTAAAPWYAYAAAARAAATDIAAAPDGQRTLSVRQGAEIESGDPGAVVEPFADRVRTRLPLPTEDVALGMITPLAVSRGGTDVDVRLAYRDDFCEQVRIDGACPAARGEVAISRAAAQRLTIGIGSRLTLRDTVSDRTVVTTVVGLYSVDDPSGAYWQSSLVRAENGLDPAFTAIDTFSAVMLKSVTLTYDSVIPEGLISRPGTDLRALLRAADKQLSPDLRLVTSADQLIGTIEADRTVIASGVATAAVQILVLAWFAIALAGRYTGRDRRPDVALLKLRGSTRLGILRLLWGQHLVPLAAGTLLGAPAGLLLARLLAGPVDDTADRTSALLIGLGAALAVLLGGLLVLAVLEALVVRLPLSELLRRTSGGRGGWRSGLADLILVAVAVTVVYQAGVGGPDGGLAPAGAGMLALAVALILARLLSHLAGRMGGAALRAGRLRTGLTALRVARQPGADRVFALVVVATTLFVTAVGGGDAEQRARAERGAWELGADRVLTVQTENRTTLLAAVRQADPDGRQAMAAVVDRVSDLPVLAVDSTRYAAVAAPGLPGAPPGAGAGGRLPLITGEAVGVRAERHGKQPARLSLLLRNETTGLVVPVDLGVAGAGTTVLRGAAPGCATGCRIVHWSLTGRTGAGVTVHSLDQLDPAGPVLGAAELGDVARWRTGSTGVALDVSTSAAGLRLDVPVNTSDDVESGSRAWPVETTLPLPAVLAGPEPDAWRFADPILGVFGTPVPVRARAVGAVPVLGHHGLFVDLEAFRRLTDEAEPPGEYQVWLAADARPGLVGDLTAAGLTVVADRTVAGRADQLGAQGPAVAARFGLLAGAAALLLAAATVAVAAAVDRGTTREQLRALRVQGLPSRVAVATGRYGVGVPVLAGLVAGLLVTIPATRVTGARVLPFTDGWDVLPPPGVLGPVAFLLGGLAALTVLGLTTWLAVRPFLRDLRDDR